MALSSTTSSNTAILSCQHLSFAYQQKNILRDISFAIEPGQFVGLIGGNGAGKSTLLRCLYRYLTPCAGVISFQQQPIDSICTKAFAQDVAVVVQETPNEFNLTVFDVVALGVVPYLSAFSRTSKAQHQQIAQAIEQVGLTDKTNQGFESLSGGEKQRALIAKAIVQQPKLLIMDEPTSHLDIKYQIDIMRLAKSLDMTVLASFHDLNLAAAISDKLLLLHQGQLVAQGEPNKVITKANIARFFDAQAHVELNANARPLVTYDYGEH
ncbi:ABC transporter ATP-binding protein [Thalassotalea sp. LPB0316]|nr:ABC transporter ATP-binding protein [Thalassotalea sp. LPB0316]